MARTYYEAVAEAGSSGNLLAVPHFSRLNQVLGPLWVDFQLVGTGVVSRVVHSGDDTGCQRWSSNVGGPAWPIDQQLCA